MPVVPTLQSGLPQLQYTTTRIFYIFQTKKDHLDINKTQHNQLFIK